MIFGGRPSPSSNFAPPSKFHGIDVANKSKSSNHTTYTRGQPAAHLFPPRNNTTSQTAQIYLPDGKTNTATMSTTVEKVRLPPTRPANPLFSTPNREFEYHHRWRLHDNHKRS